MTPISRRKVLLLFIFTPLLLFIQLVIGFAVYTDIKNMRQIEAVNSKLDLYLRTNTKYVSMAESAQRGYLLTGDTKYKETFALSREEVRKNEEVYTTLPSEIKKGNILSIRSTTDNKISEMGQTITLNDAGHRDEALDLVKSNIGKLMMDSIRTASNAIRTGITAQVTEERAREDKLFTLFFIVITILIVFNVFLVYYTYSAITAYTQKLESLVTSLEDANGRMREYTSMSYHELKTPLRNIHGFAQLLRSRHMAGEETSEEGEFISYITDGIRQMNKTIDDMRERYLDKGNT